MVKMRHLFATLAAIFNTAPWRSLYPIFEWEEREKSVRVSPNLEILKARRDLLSGYMLVRHGSLGYDRLVAGSISVIEDLR